MKLTELLLERQPIHKPKYDASEKKQLGPIRDWFDEAGLAQEDVDAAVKQIKKSAIFKKVTTEGEFDYDGTARTEGNGTLRFTSRKDGKWYMVMGNGLLRSEGAGSLSRTRLRSPKARQVPGNHVKTLVRTYENALEALLKKKIVK